MNQFWQRLRPGDNSAIRLQLQRRGLSSEGGSNANLLPRVEVEEQSGVSERTALLSDRARTTSTSLGFNTMIGTASTNTTTNDPSTNDDAEHVEEGDDEVTTPLQSNADTDVDTRTNHTNDNETNDNENNNNNNNNNTRPDTATATNDPITSITNRLRCLFACITLPILPLGTLLVLLLINLLYAGVQEINLNCSHFDDSIYSNVHHDDEPGEGRESPIVSHYHPLKAYALSSLLLSLYAPQHKHVKQYLFGYVRERDGPNRPAAVRIYDQLFYLLCFWYIYSGTLIIQSCKVDMVTMNLHSEISESVESQTIGFDMGQSMCQINCPKLYAATRGYVVTLQIFGLVLLLPLICLPFVYLWIVRRVSSDDARDWFSRNGGEGDDPYSLSGDRVMVKDIMDNLEEVTVIRVPGTSDGKNMVKVIPNVGKDEEEKIYEEDLVKDCCICMNQFDIQDSINVERDVESLTVTPKSDTDKLNPGSNDDNDDSGDKPLINTAASSPLVEGDSIVMTKCGHIFHRSCLGSWVSGNWRESNGRAHSRFCPLCREDLAPPRNDTSE